MFGFTALHGDKTMRRMQGRHRRVPWPRLRHRSLHAASYRRRFPKQRLVYPLWDGPYSGMEPTHEALDGANEIKCYLRAKILQYRRT